MRRPRTDFSEMELIFKVSTKSVAACDKPSGIKRSISDETFPFPKFNMFLPPEFDPWLVEDFHSPGAQFRSAFRYKSVQHLLSASWRCHATPESNARSLLHQERSFRLRNVQSIRNRRARPDSQERFASPPPGHRWLRVSLSFSLRSRPTRQRGRNGRGSGKSGRHG